MAHNESRNEYDRLVAEWLTNQKRNPGNDPGLGGDTNVNERVLAYLR